MTMDVEVKNVTNIFCHQHFVFIKKLENFYFWNTLCSEHFLLDFVQCNSSCLILLRMNPVKMSLSRLPYEAPQESEDNIKQPNHKNEFVHFDSSEIFSVSEDDLQCLIFVEKGMILI